jgi:hypothetical protein
MCQIHPIGNATQHVPSHWIVRTGHDLNYGPVQEKKKTTGEAKKKRTLMRIGGQHLTPYLEPRF